MASTEELAYLSDQAYTSQKNGTCGNWLALKEIPLQHKDAPDFYEVY